MLSNFQNQIAENNIQVRFLVIDGAEAKSSLKYSYDRYKSQKPRRNKSAFLLFSSEKRPQIKAQEGGRLNSNQIMAKLADLWNRLPQKDRRKYETAAKKDKARYLEEMEVFKRENPDARDSHNRTKKNHVKKPSSAYGLFLKDVTAEIKRENPKLLMADVLKVVSQRWKTLDPIEKQKYQDKAKKEKEMSQAQLGYKLLKDHHIIDLDTLVNQTKASQYEKITKKVRRDTSDSVSTNSNTQSSQYTTPIYEPDSQGNTPFAEDKFKSFNFDAFEDGFLSPAPLYSEQTFEVSQMPQIQMPIASLPPSQEWNLPTTSHTLTEASKEGNGLCEIPELLNIRTTSGLSMFNDGTNLLRNESFTSFVCNSPKLSLTKFPSIDFSQDLSFQENWMNSFQQ